MVHDDTHEEENFLIELKKSAEASYIEPFRSSAGFSVGTGSSKSCVTAVPRRKGAQCRGVRIVCTSIATTSAEYRNRGNARLRKPAEELNDSL